MQPATYMGFTKETYRENLAGYQAQHSRGLMTDTWITPKDILERLIADAEAILASWDELQDIEGD